jgi:hypothetical protein
MTGIAYLWAVPRAGRGILNRRDSTRILISEGAIVW